MTDGGDCRGITIFTGRFGGGKSEAAIGYALHLARSDVASLQALTFAQVPTQSSRSAARNLCILIDLDVVTPYFRTREAAATLRDLGVEVISPSAVGQHLDTPAITPQIMGAIQQCERPVVLDVGGDRQGARALGQFSPAISQRGYTMHFVVNPYRPFTDSLAGVSSSIAEIEASARLRVTSLVSNPNLMCETTADLITDGHRRVEDYARRLGLPVAFVCVERRWADHFGSNHFAQPLLILDRFLLHPWEC